MCQDKCCLHINKVKGINYISQCVSSWPSMEAQQCTAANITKLKPHKKINDSLHALSTLSKAISLHHNFTSQNTGVAVVSPPRSTATNVSSEHVKTN